MKRISLAALFLSSLSLAASPKGAVPFARASLVPVGKSNVKGTVEIAKLGDALFLRFHVENLAPGPHGVHFHEKGDCSSADGSSAGAHWNPTGSEHSSPVAKHRHQGDLGNLNVPTAEATTPIDIKVGSPPEGAKGWDEVIGRSIIIHAKADDLKTSPAGASGDRVACGVVESLRSTH